MSKNVQIVMLSLSYVALSFVMYDLIPEFIIYDKSRFIILLPILVVTLIIPAIATIILSKKYSKRIVISSLMLAGLGGYVAADYYRLHEVDKEMQNGSMRTRGKVFEKVWDTRSSQWQIRCEFYVEGNRYVTFLTEDLQDQVKLNDSMNIIYLKRNPEISRIQDLKK